jgi:lysophospholipase L1-like esterase
MNVLALGDSIIWGQGNADDTKFINLVCAWLRARGEQPSLTLLAHSGAVVSPTQNDHAPALWGEVPEAAPSVMAQIQAAPARVAPEAVDLVLLDGGINDLNAFHIVGANPFDPNALENIGAQCTQIFTGPVHQMIARTVATFTKARIVVIGYYPIVSEKTGLRSLAQLMKQLPSPPGVARFLDLTVEHLPEDLLAVAIDLERRRIIEQSALFATLSSRLLAAAVGTHAATGRVFFAAPDFAPENAFAAPKTWLWAGSDDPLYRARLDKYAEHALQNPFDWPVFTPLASMCHPNVDGSRAYAAAIEACLG